MQNFMSICTLPRGGSLACITVLQGSGPKKTKLYDERFLPPNKEKAIQEDSGIRLSWFEISFGHLSARSSWASSYLLCAVIGDGE